MTSRRVPALIGVASVAAALGVAELVAIVTGPLTSPGIAVGGAIIDLVPESLKHFAITLFGTYDKLALQIGTLLLLVLAGVGLGFLARRRLTLALCLVAAFALLGLVSAVTRYDAGWTAVFPSVLAGTTGALTLRTLTLRSLPLRSLPLRSAPQDPDDLAVVVPPKEGQDGANSGTTTARSTGGEGAGRREVLRIAGGVAVVGGLAGFGGRWLSLRRSVSADRAAVTLPAPASPAPVLPASVDAELPGLARFVTSNRSFYRIDTALVVPQVAPDEWTLKIHGRVRNPLTITFDQLLARPMIERYITLACVSNEVGGGLISNARWLGVRLGDLLAEADPEPGADQVVSRSVDGFTAGTPTDVLRDGRDAILAVGMNGEPLPIEHGFPVRMVVPGLYGYVSATKWLAELELTSFADFDAYWIRRGWSAKAPIKLQSRIDTPTRRASAGAVVVGGVAWAQHVGVSAVELRVDDGVWQPARLYDVPSTDTWCQWTVTWDATPGTHTLTVRAVDAAGRAQDETVRPVLPDGATGLHTVEVDVS
jgi:DMSO/TMAO reductase YedYZ molybdopterin-dependent catalytic subunit